MFTAKKKKKKYVCEVIDKLIHFAAKQKLAHYCKASVHKSKLIKRECIFVYAAAVAESLQSCLTLCDPIDGSPPGSLGFSSKNTGVGCHFLLQHLYIMHAK